MLVGKRSPNHQDIHLEKQLIKILKMQYEHTNKIIKNTYYYDNYADNYAKYLKWLYTFSWVKDDLLELEA